MRATLSILALVVATTARAQESGPPVIAEFRIFAGTAEITDSTRLRIMPTEARDKATVIGEGRHLVTSVPPGIYDVQAQRLRYGSIIAIKWAERLVMMHYPDEGGRHLEVINFEPGFGALQVRAARGAIEAYAVEAFPTGNRTTAEADPVGGDGYRLFVLKAGRYDIRVHPVGQPDDSQDTQWFLDVEIPADRTRLKLVDVR